MGYYPAMSKTVILMPTYNERENIKLIVPEIFARHPDLYITVIDDNSPDRTDDAVRVLMKKYPKLSLLSRQKKEGLGMAYKHGIRHTLAQGDVGKIITMDADGTHDVGHLKDLLKASEKYQLVIGSRYASGGVVGQWVLWRRILSRGGNFYARMLSGMPVHDMTAGFLVLSRTLLDRLDLDRVPASGYAFLIDLKYHAIREAHATVKEVPINLKARREGESKISSHVVREGVLLPWRLLARRLKGYHPLGNASDTLPFSCAVCGSPEIRFYCHKRGYRLFQCKDCDLVFVYPMPSNLEAIYGEEYFHNVDQKESHGYTDYDKDKEPMRAAFEWALGKVEAKVGGRKIFDIGAATGYFLDVARDRGWKTQGSEVSAYGAKEAAERGHGMILGDVTHMTNLPKVDAVTMWDVIEHVADPVALAAAANRMLPKGGILVINTPDVGSVWARLLKGKWQLLVPPEHVHYYARRNMNMLLGQAGFELVESSRMGKTFSVPYVFKMLWSWQGLAMWDVLARMTDNSIFRWIKLPINLRDNMFVIARKVHDV
ncbi:glycosyltransferase [Candidatus Kaiserbacteria bacterium]|nr:glycosyltransferase [Candidatus Kaiserbacteria bacterium]